ncbi:plasmid mobilization protein [Xanthomonas hortorum]|uniref:MobC family plasmid mobilization relaxosome protein n=1 Tax=Xanthomonas hortorum TaxID=56454 RepID=A0AA47IC81_9XANT|nr:plasmid mobilization relaxosome protein MobC [Xanthomonas hortorum]WAH66886.1 MobC family plasmid mobilization relaxosome protein [Xanthomonas hortorum]
MSRSNARQRTKQSLVRLSDEEYALLSERADASGVTLTDYIRSQALGAKPLRAQRRPSVDRAALAQLLGRIGVVGGNVNQIARKLNSGQSADYIDLMETMKEVREMRGMVMIALGVDPNGGKS